MRKYYMEYEQNIITKLIEWTGDNNHKPSPDLGCILEEITEKQYNLLRNFDGNLKWAQEEIDCLHYFIK